MTDRLSRTIGCMLGGAVCDAMGAPVESIGLEEIFSHYGKEGVTEFNEAYGRIGCHHPRPPIRLSGRRFFLGFDFNDSNRCVLENGKEVIPNKWLSDLEMKNVIEEVATDLAGYSG
jgi:hypothetical protein